MCRIELLKLVLAGGLAVIWSRIVLSATEYPLLYVIPWLMGAVRPPPLPWW